MAPKFLKKAFAKTKAFANKVANQGQKIGGKIVNAYNKGNQIGAKIVANLPDVARKINNTGETISSTADTLGRKATKTAQLVDKLVPEYTRKAQNTGKIIDRKYQKSLIQANKWYQKGQKAMDSTKGFIDKVKNSNLPKFAQNAFKAVTKIPLEQQVATPQDPNPPVDLPAAVPPSTSNYTVLNSNQGDFADS